MCAPLTNEMLNQANYNKLSWLHNGKNIFQKIDKFLFNAKSHLSHPIDNVSIKLLVSMKKRGEKMEWKTKMCN